MNDKEFKEYAIEKVNKYLKKSHSKQHIISTSKVYKTRCEWCSNTTKVIHINLSPSEFCSYPCTTIFEDSSFKLQHEWWVCGKCKES